MLPQLGHPAQTTSDDDFGIGDYYSATQRRRVQALDRLGDELRRRSWQGRRVTPAHVWDMPAMRVYDLETCTHRGQVEVRGDLGLIDWICWRGGDRIAPADSPELAAGTIIEALDTDR